MERGRIGFWSLFCQRSTVRWEQVSTSPPRPNVLTIVLHGLRAAVTNTFAQMQSMLWIDVKNRFTGSQSLTVDKAL